MEEPFRINCTVCNPRGKGSTFNSVDLVEISAARYAGRCALCGVEVSLAVGAAAEPSERFSPGGAMPSLDIRLDGELAFADLPRDRIVGKVFDPIAKQPIWLGRIFRLAVIPRGTQSGLPTVALAIELPDGALAFGETTARLFCSAARAVRARHPIIDSD